MNKKLISSLLMVVCMLGSKAQPNFELFYVTDFRTNFGRNYNWTNLLQLTAEIPTETISNRWKNGKFIIQPITVYSLFEDPVIDDLLGYSNIFADNLPLNFLVFGYEHHWGRFSLFAGVRNITADYFYKDYMSLFTRGANGMAPTLSSNFPMADYPFSAMSLHAEFFMNDNWFFQTSLHNGVAHNPARNPLRAFTVNPRNDGIFSISQISYSQNKIGRGSYSLGFAMHSFGSMRPSFFGKFEQTLLENEQHEIGITLQGGYSAIPTRSGFDYHLNGEPRCKFYFGIGGYFRGFLSRSKRDAFGIHFTSANFENINERALEITWKYQLFNQLSIQPTFHLVQTGGTTRSVGMLRFVLQI
ncbi:MAG: carbohydrate porin [Bacteroidales bacterium]|nr:carbohydrate porin [Bacteroidales bacterium]